MEGLEVKEAIKPPDGGEVFLESAWEYAPDQADHGPALLAEAGVRGTPVGWTIGGGVAREPLGIDFSKPPPHTMQKK